MDIKKSKLNYYQVNLLMPKFRKQTIKKYINFWFLPIYTDVCSTVYSVLSPSPVEKITGILLGWDSNHSIVVNKYYYNDSSALSQPEGHIKALNPWSLGHILHPLIHLSQFYTNL